MLKRYKWLLFAATFFTVFLLYNYKYALTERPGVTHQWAQCDRLSFALNYYQRNLPFLSPEILWVGNKGNSKTVSEMPILYFMMGNIWKITGHSEFIFRILMLLLMVTALAMWFKFLSAFLDDTVSALVVVVLFFCSPSLAYYALGFLMDAPAVAFSMMGWVLYFAYYERRKNLLLIISVALFTLSALIKFSSIINLTALGIVFLFFLAGFDKGSKRFFKGYAAFIVCAFISGVLIASWYLFALHYNKENTSGVFLTDLLPIWQYPASEVMDMYNAFTRTGLYNFYGGPVLIVIPLLLFIILFRLKRYCTAHPIFLVSVSMFFLSLLVMALWFKNLHHDYYMIQHTITVLLLLSASAFILKNNFKWFTHRIFKSAVLIFVLWNVGYASIKHTMRYIILEKKNVYTTYSFFIPPWDIFDDQEVLLKYNKSLKPLETIEPYLRSLGIKKEDRVISFPDVSPQATLYLMNQPGFTEFGRNIKSRDEVVHLIKDLNAKYLILSDTYSVLNTELSPFTKNKIGGYKNVGIYRLQ